MGDKMKSTRERLDKEFHEIAAMDKWSKDNLTTMKDILKSMYYIDVICAMKEGEERPEYDEMMSGQRRNSMGQFSRNGMSGMYPYPRNTYDRGYDSNNSGRRYYDSEKDHAIQELRHKAEVERNPEIKMAYQRVIDELEMR